MLHLTAKNQDLLFPVKTRLKPYLLRVLEEK